MADHYLEMVLQTVSVSQSTMADHCLEMVLQTVSVSQDTMADHCLEMILLHSAHHRVLIGGSLRQYEWPFTEIVQPWILMS